MIKYASRTLPYSERVYIALRVAFLETQERLLLAGQLQLDGHRSFGYLTHVPFLKSVPAQVQLDLLLGLWDRHLAKETFSANYLDEAILYAACETTSQLIRQHPVRAGELIERGPLASTVSLSSSLADQVQQLHLDLAPEGHFLLLSQFQDIPPEKAQEYKRQYGISDGMCDSLFEAMSRWHVSPGYADRAVGLLTETEIAALAQIPEFEKHSEKSSPSG